MSGVLLILWVVWAAGVGAAMWLVSDPEASGREQLFLTGMALIWPLFVAWLLTSIIWHGLTGE